MINNNIDKIEKGKEIEKLYNKFIIFYIILAIISFVIFIFNIIINSSITITGILLMMIILSINGMIGMSINRNRWIKKNTEEE